MMARAMAARTMESMDKLNAVFSKWDKGGPRRTASGPARSGPEYDNVLQQGRQQWRDKFKEANLSQNRYRPTRQRHRGRRDDYVPELDVDQYMANLAFFKTMPTVTAVNSRYSRPFMGRCCGCMPYSKLEFHDEDVSNMPIKNILAVPTKRSEQPWVTRTFHHAVFAMQRKVNHRYPDVSLAVLTNPRLVEAIQHTAMEEQGVADAGLLSPDVRKKHEKAARCVLKKMKATISNNLIRLTGWFLHKLLGHLYSAVLVHEGQLAMLQEATQRDVPIVFLPTHRSHMDYILLTFLLFNIDIQAPHVAAGDNLLMPFFGSLMRGLGGYFIRRRLDHKDGSKDLIYRAVLHTYMEQLLHQGEYFEFFLEGGRSRSGKCLSPRGGLLSIVVDSYMEGVIPDAYIVPVSFSYEKLIDGNFRREQMGEAKKGESFWRTWKAIITILFSHFGNVRIDFAQPFSLKEYLEVSQSFELESEMHSHFEADAMEKRNKVVLSGSNSSLFGLEDHRSTIQSLSEHVVHSFSHQQAPMSTHMVSFLMLTLHRQGVTLRDLETSLEWLRGELMAHRRDLGYCGQTRDVISHACDLLGSDLITVTPPHGQNGDRNNNSSDDTFLRPNLGLPQVMDLTYYANPVISLFALEAVMALSVCLEADDRLWTHAGNEGLTTVSKGALLQQAVNLAHIFQYEFVFKLPCKSWEVVLNETLDQLVTGDILKHLEDEVGPDADWARRYSRSMAWDSDGEDDAYVPQDIEFQVNDEAYSLERLRLLVTSLGPLVETYHIIACHLTQLNDKRSESEFVKDMQLVLKTRVSEGIAAYAESAAIDTIQNCLRSLTQMKILDVTAENGTRYIQLRDSEDVSKHVEQLLELMDACKLSNMV